MTADRADEPRLARLNRLIHASGFETSFAVLEDLPGDEEISTQWVDHDPYALVARRLPDAEAEAKVLHEVAHWTLAHEFDYAFRAAAGADASGAGGTRRGPWEIEADALAAALADDLRALLGDPSGSLEALIADAARFMEPPSVLA